ncbi:MULTISPECIES: phosphoethanolamine--lipid A transferase [Hydrocarboniphaga]|jgi:lipid A ethanolaminephosphotransferase|uniref:phosphoethanolamine transferase n=1 Tax=Hydrocarboniphaga TaxID=243627 RepID=UPI002ABB1F83|nr:phosphoethanolamine--lipid A transferase [Hydrocarboniphaga sp.]MDZ4077864.1 phosphoethanolamine--lipid A transferase [Hydrocarboniphaga sp.]
MNIGPVTRANAGVGVSPTTMLLIVVMFLTLTQNQALAKAVVASLPTPFGMQEWRIAGSALITAINLTLLALVPLSWKPILKPALIFFVLTASVCSYFMDSFGTVIDRSMITNVMRTDFDEASDLLRGYFWLHLAVHGILPSILLWFVPIRWPSFRIELRNRVLLVVAIFAIQIPLLLLQYNTLSFWGRQHREVRLLMNPTAPISTAIDYVRHQYRESNARPADPIALDAKRDPVTNPRPFLMVLMLGETARAQNFQIDGYSRPTNPRLSADREIVNFGSVTSCGTATAESVPCIFSGLGRKGFSQDRAARRENVLDVLQRVGVHVTWWDNDSGCQGVCNRIPSERFEKRADPSLCASGECLDGILLQDLPRMFPQEQQSALLVLHMKGSHGPAYFKRYPESARHFTPDCRDENVQRCSLQEVVNAYDNTLVYTDEVVSDLIQTLRSHADQFDSTVLYVSDHGESLGENGIFLHGLPYALAPAQQTHVPMFMWFSSGARQRLNVDANCLQQAAGSETSHDAIFHSLMGLFSVRSEAYQPDLDLLHGCRPTTRTPEH